MQMLCNRHIATMRMSSTAEDLDLYSAAGLPLHQGVAICNEISSVYLKEPCNLANGSLTLVSNTRNTTTYISALAYPSCFFDFTYATSRHWAQALVSCRMNHQHRITLPRSVWASCCNAQGGIHNRAGIAAGSHAKCRR